VPVSPLARSELPADTSPVRFLEPEEASVAGRVGLCAAVQQYLDIGPARIWQRLAEVGSLTRQALIDLPGWSVTGGTSTPTAITALQATNGQDIREVRTRLLAEYRILTTAGAVARAPREMTEPLLRISPHVDCTPDELALLHRALAELR
jgi:pyridoxal 5-phosphate dependent beta-lyase